MGESQSKQIYTCEYEILPYKLYLCQTEGRIVFLFNDYECYLNFNYCGATSLDRIINKREVSIDVAKRVDAGYQQANINGDSYWYVQC